MNVKSKVLIVEDHTIVRQSLESMIGLDSDYAVIGGAEDGFEALQKIRESEPDLILLDLNMPKMDGFSVITEAKREFPKTRILVLTIHKSDEYVHEAFRRGADGYCLKDATQSELFEAMKAVLSAKPYISPSIAGSVLKGYLEKSKEIDDSSTWNSLTQREREVLKLVGEGYTSKEIAELLAISPKTAETHRANIMKKLDLHSSAALTNFAIEKGLVSDFESVKIED